MEVEWEDNYSICGTKKLFNMGGGAYLIPSPPGNNTDAYRHASHRQWGLASPGDHVQPGLCSS